MKTLVNSGVGSFDGGTIKLLGTLIHHRHRSPINAFTHLFAGFINYQIRTDKPSLDQLLKLNP